MAKRGKRFEPTEETRKLVEQMAAVGITRDQICSVVELSLKTLLKYFRKELETSATKANAKMGGALYANGIRGNVTAQIFWMKTRAGWREKDHEDSSKEQPPSTIVLNVMPKPDR